MFINVIPLIVPLAVVPEPAPTKGNKPVRREVAPLAEGQKGKAAGRHMPGDDVENEVGRQVDTEA